MRYRVAFNFWTVHGCFYTEWFDTYEEAWDFVQRGKAAVHMLGLYDENHNLVPC